MRVAVYSRISGGIRDGILPAGVLLPREIELGNSLGVSRTVVREALMLLEEDGLITTKRGVGRFVANSLPAQTLGEFQSLEQLLSGHGRSIAVEVLEFTRQPVTDFVSEHLGLAVDASFWFRESVVARDGARMALVQEYVPDEHYLSALSPEVASCLPESADTATTLLNFITQRLGPVFTDESCDVAATIAGPTRAGHLDVKSSDPLLVLTQTARLNSVAAYISKSALAPAFGHLAITQWKPA
nr:GntR family transcriptional regulator [Terrimesophilobacter mesophilus]